MTQVLFYPVSNTTTESSASSLLDLALTTPNANTHMLDSLMDTSCSPSASFSSPRSPSTASAMVREVRSRQAHLFLRQSPLLSTSTKNSNSHILALKKRARYQQAILSEQFDTASSSKGKIPKGPHPDLITVPERRGERLPSITRRLRRSPAKPTQYSGAQQFTSTLTSKSKRDEHADYHIRQQKQHQEQPLFDSQPLVSVIENVTRPQTSAATARAPIRRGRLVREVMTRWATKASRGCANSEHFVKSAISAMKSFIRYFGCPARLLVAVLVYTERYLTQLRSSVPAHSPQSASVDSLSTLSSRELFRVLLTSTLVTVKFWSDEGIIDNSDVADIVGIPVKELNARERSFLAALDYNLYLAEGALGVYESAQAEELGLF
mmetsp:Transcript_42523/g.107283  ORF Transcript_42523/g.107283 Transcript_42523/m.107283 type:complete len:380 (+) Transcript_42523:125-1264(+)|eukprot:CAMPEP_0174231248 /NCGR_PEP_ID=MMETSP0417-20130205/1809_1 /TAXON_ID=242541 /ORGANISM="Mayorella sp, Strain BSH-02190019" /LENGTH=379 /DNA_ID=CAMNT_0015309095 /DNA_START=130 /DNA_END=1269 /DNA_ORIENTATION=-